MVARTGEGGLLSFSDVRRPATMQRVMSSQAAARPARKPLWTRGYLLLCLSMGLAYVHEGLLVPTIPLYVQSLTGSTAIVGLVLGLFSLLGFTIRPFLGQLADRANPRFVFLLGTLCLSVCDLAFVIPVFGLICIVSAVRGAGWAGVNTGGNTVLASWRPPNDGPRAPPTTACPRAPPWLSRRARLCGSLRATAALSTGQCFWWPQAAARPLRCCPGGSQRTSFVLKGRTHRPQPGPAGATVGPCCMTAAYSYPPDCWR